MPYRFDFLRFYSCRRNAFLDIQQLVILLGGGMLSEQDAIVIYEEKISLLRGISMDAPSRKQLSSLWGQTGPVSRKFGVSSRTVKYIWNRQTWAHATNHLWPNEAIICQMIQDNQEASRRANATQVLQNHTGSVSQNYLLNSENRPNDAETNSNRKISTKARQMKEIRMIWMQPIFKTNQPLSKLAFRRAVLQILLQYSKVFRTNLLNLS